MSFKLITDTLNFIGSSIDTKPIVGIPIGSKFYEKDSGDTYVFDGFAWHNMTSPTTSTTAPTTTAAP